MSLNLGNFGVLELADPLLNIEHWNLVDVLFDNFFIQITDDRIDDLLDAINWLFKFVTFFEQLPRD